MLETSVFFPIKKQNSVNYLRAVFDKTLFKYHDFKIKQDF